MLNQILKEYILKLPPLFEQISPDRKKLLDEISAYIKTSDSPQLNFICTHNSRRSHLGQIWAQTAASYFYVKSSTYSGGTEATAFHPNAIASLERAGFVIESPKGTNPKVKVYYDESAEPMICFSKTYDDDFNPNTNFAAIMTCSEADQECPVVFGATERIKLLYEDPKVADGTPAEKETYDERCKQIATEMFYVFSTVK